MRDASPDRIRRHVEVLAGEIGARPAGSPAGRRAEAYVAEGLSAQGLVVERQAFRCLDWRPGDASVRVGARTIAAVASPWSPGCEVRGEAVAAATLEELAGLDARGRIVVVHGALAREALFPRAFPFLTVERHRAIADALEAAAPLAVVAGSPDPARPVALIEDGDLPLPVVTVAREDVGAVLAAPGPIDVRSGGARTPGEGANVIGRLRATAAERVVVTAHLDTKPATPGALDDASGVAALLELARVLDAAPEGRGVELAILNGEDHYAAPGQRRYLETAAMGRVRLAINVDGVGLAGSAVGVAPMAMPKEMERRARRLLDRHPDLRALGPWPQGDHMLFVGAGVPSLAVTSVGIFDVLETIVHTPADTPDGVDARRIAAACRFVADALAL
jgi:aminopeptidase YwaD